MYINKSFFKYEKIKQIDVNQNVENPHLYNIDCVRLNREYEQNNTNLCWLTSSLTVLSCVPGCDFNISMSYFLFWHYIEKCNRLFNITAKQKQYKCDRVVLNAGVDDSGDWNDFCFIIKKYGVVTNEQFNNNAYVENSARINIILTRYCKIICNKLLNDYNEALHKTALKNIYNFLATYLGNPTYIENLTLSKIYRKTIQDFTKIVNLQNNPEDNSFKTMQSLIKQQLKNKIPVMIGVDSRHGLDFKNKIFKFNPKRIEAEIGLNILPSRDCGFSIGSLKINHYLVVVGIDQKNNIWKLWDNSRQNYILAEQRWINNYLFEAIIEKRLLSY